MLLLAAVLAPILSRLFCFTFRSPLDILFHVSLFPGILYRYWRREVESFLVFFSLLPHFWILYKTFLFVAALHGRLACRRYHDPCLLGVTSAQLSPWGVPLHTKKHCGVWAMFTTVSWTRPALVLQPDTGDKDGAGYSVFIISFKLNHSTLKLTRAPFHSSVGLEGKHVISSGWCACYE